jgi:hypothetical protein
MPNYVLEVEPEQIFKINQHYIFFSTYFSRSASGPKEPPLFHFYSNIAFLFDFTHPTIFFFSKDKILKSKLNNFWIFEFYLFIYFRDFERSRFWFSRFYYRTAKIFIFFFLKKYFLQNCYFFMDFDQKRLNIV